MELLETTALSHELEKIITGSNKYLIIVTPYLQISKRIKPKLEECFSRNKRTLILYRENRLNSFEMDWFDKFKNVSSLSVKDLHAKCYINENNCLVTSMNWYEHSQINNHEMGVKFDTENNPNEVNQILGMVNTIIKTDYHDRSISEFTEFKDELTMGLLYAELVADYHFPKTTGGFDSVYKNMCDIALKYHKFLESDFRKDKSALLRSAVISKNNYEIIKNQIITNVSIKPEDIEEEYDFDKFKDEWHSFLTTNYPDCKFQIDGQSITARDFPCKNVDYSNQYGFASFVFNLGYDYMAKVKRMKEFDVLTNLKEYRLYWSPSHKMNLYHAKKIKFKNVKEDVKYCATALHKLIPEIKKFANS